MNVERRIFTPVTTTIIAGLLVAAATIGGTLSGDASSHKSDRFAVAGDALCANQVWPNLTSECLAWAEGETSDEHVRFVTLASTDRDAGLTTLTRARPESIETH